MSIGSTAGRGFESAAAPYVWGAILVGTLLLWVLFQREIRKWQREERLDSEGNDQDET